jgi:uncharacterized protein YbjT (DUF2867 family)
MGTQASFIAVLGATGNMGRQLVPRLLERGIGCNTTSHTLEQFARDVFVPAYRAA